VAIDEGVGRQEALCLPRRLEPLHLPFPASGWSVRVLGAIVEVAALAVLDIRQQFELRHTVAPKLVGYEDARHILQTLQQPLEETLCRRGVAAALHQDVEHDPVLIDGAPKMVQLALNSKEDLIQVPLVTWSGAAPAKFARETGAELDAPAPDALVRDDHAAFGQDQLDIPKAQAEHVVQPERG